MCHNTTSWLDLINPIIWFYLISSILWFYLISSIIWSNLISIISGFDLIHLNKLFFLLSPCGSCWKALPTTFQIICLVRPRPHRKYMRMVYPYIPGSFSYSNLRWTCNVGLVQTWVSIILSFSRMEVIEICICSTLKRATPVVLQDLYSLQTGLARSSPQGPPWYVLVDFPVLLLVNWRLGCWTFIRVLVFFLYLWPYQFKRKIQLDTL